MLASPNHIVTLADAYGAAFGVPEITVSHRVFGDSKKLAAIRNGADLTIGRYVRALEWFSCNWPAAVVWPAGIPRPEGQPEAAE